MNLVGFGSTASRLFDGAEKLRGPRFGEAVTYARRLQANLGGTEAGDVNLPGGGGQGVGLKTSEPPVTRWVY